MIGFEDDVSMSQKLKYLRSQTDMNQEEFARYLQIPVRKYRSWEQGTRNPSAGVPELIQRVLISENMIPCPSPQEKASPHIAVLKAKRKR